MKTHQKVEENKKKKERLAQTHSLRIARKGSQQCKQFEQNRNGTFNTKFLFQITFGQTKIVDVSVCKDAVIELNVEKRGHARKGREREREGKRREEEVEGERDLRFNIYLYSVS